MKHAWNKFLAEGESKTTGIVACLDDKQQFLIIRRSSIDERKGQIAAVRELDEETNLRCKVVDLTYLGEPKNGKHYFLTQKWTGDVDVDKPNPKSGEIEHDDYKWTTIEEIKDIDNTEIPIYLLEKALEMSKNETDS